MYFVVPSPTETKYELTLLPRTHLQCNCCHRKVGSINRIYTTLHPSPPLDMLTAYTTVLLML